VDSRNVPGSRGARCLIFDSDGVVRRLWTFPENWELLCDDELFALLDATPKLPRITPAMVPAHPIGRDGDHPAVAAATAIAARARTLLIELSLFREQSRSLRNDQRELLADCARMRAKMRAAVESYAGTLRHEGIAPEQALLLVKTAMEDGLGGPTGRDEPGADEIVRDGVAWAISAYYAA
jgi:hypothetical protein